MRMQANDGAAGGVFSSLRVSLSHRDWGVLPGKPSGFSYSHMEVYSTSQIVKFPHIEFCCLQT